MSTKRDEALKLALEAMTYADACLKKQLTTKGKHQYAQDLLLEAGTAIREALAERCVCGEPDTPGTHRTDGPCFAEQPAQQQEPVAWVWRYNDGDEEATLLDPQYFDHNALGISSITPLYTSPPAQRKPLTDEEIVAKALHLSGLGTSPDVIQFARAIEAKLREKNA